MSEPTNCPFYGRHLALGLFVDSQGNQCALVARVLGRRVLVALVVAVAAAVIVYRVTQ
jgi:hypothetical protein